METRVSTVFHKIYMRERGIYKFHETVSQAFKQLKKLFKKYK